MSIAALALIQFLCHIARVHETGILLSAGKSKWEILTQRMTEMILITVLALGMAYVCTSDRHQRAVTLKIIVPLIHKSTTYPLKNLPLYFTEIWLLVERFEISLNRILNLL